MADDASRCAPKAPGEILFTGENRALAPRPPYSRLLPVKGLMMAVVNNLLSVPKNYLMLIVGILWLFAGTMIMTPSFPIFLTMISFINILFSATVFLIFYLLIFSKLVKRHTERIKKNNNQKMPFWQFFDTRSYIMMVTMMVCGISVQKLHLLPDPITGPFFLGLGFALFLGGIRFIAVFFRKRVLAAPTE